MWTWTWTLLDSVNVLRKEKKNTKNVGDQTSVAEIM